MPSGARTAGCTLAASLLLLTTSALGLVIQLTDQELTEMSDRIALGTVTGVTSSWNVNMDFITTAVTVQVEQDIKGTGSNPLVVTLHGGSVGDITLTVSEMPEFEAGQRVVVFLGPFTGSDYQVVGLFQGKFTIVDGFVQETGETEQDFLARIASYLPPEK